MGLTPFVPQVQSCLLDRSDPRLHEVTWWLYETQKWKENLAVRRTKRETGYNLCILCEVSAGTKL